MSLKDDLLIFDIVLGTAVSPLVGDQGLEARSPPFWELVFQGL